MMRRRRRLIRPGESFEFGENIELERVEPVPEPPDIDRISREHDEDWRRRFRDDDNEV